MVSVENDSSGPERLAKNSIGLAEIVFFVVAAAAPLTAVVGATPPAFAFGNGAGVPGAFVLAGVLYIIFSVGFTAMSRHIGGTGAFYTYISQGICKEVGVGGAMIALLTYSAIQMAIYALFGVFASGALAEFGVTVDWWECTYVALFVVLLCGQRNVAFSGAILGVAMICEVAILLLLDVGILAAGGGPEGISFTSFMPSDVFVPGLGVALVFVVGSFVGFEATAIFSEEAKTPEKTIPRATYVAVVSITLFYAFSTWAIVQYYGSSKIQAAAGAGLETLFFVAADAVLGTWASKVMNLLLIVSLFACTLSLHNTINRYFFSMGREGLALSILGKVHDTHGSPYIAGLVQSLVAAVILGLFIGSGADPYTVIFSLSSAVGVIGILSVQVLVCIAIIMYFRKNHHEHGVWTTVLSPALALMGLGGMLALVVTNLPLLTGSEGALTSSLPWGVAATGLLGVLAASRVRISRPEVYARLGSVFD